MNVLRLQDVLEKAMVKVLAEKLPPLRQKRSYSRGLSGDAREPVTGNSGVSAIPPKRYTKGPK